MAVYNDCSLRQYLCKNNTNLTETCQILFIGTICIIKLPPHSYGEFRVDVTRERSGIELQRTIILHHNQIKIKVIRAECATIHAMMNDPTFRLTNITIIFYMNQTE